MGGIAVQTLAIVAADAGLELIQQEQPMWKAVVTSEIRTDQPDDHSEFACRRTWWLVTEFTAIAALVNPFPKPSPSTPPQ